MPSESSPMQTWMLPVTGAASAVSVIALLALYKLSKWYCKSRATPTGAELESLGYVRVAPKTEATALQPVAAEPPTYHPIYNTMLDKVQPAQKIVPQQPMQYRSHQATADTISQQPTQFLPQQARPRSQSQVIEMANMRRRMSMQNSSPPKLRMANGMRASVSASTILTTLEASRISETAETEQPKTPRKPTTEDDDNYIGAIRFSASYSEEHQTLTVCVHEAVNLPTQKAKPVGVFAVTLYRAAPDELIGQSTRAEKGRRIDYNEKLALYLPKCSLQSSKVLLLVEEVKGQDKRVTLGFVDCPMMDLLCRSSLPERTANITSRGKAHVAGQLDVSLHYDATQQILDIAVLDGSLLGAGSTGDRRFSRRRSSISAMLGQVGIIARVHVIEKTTEITSKEMRPVKEDIHRPVFKQSITLETGDIKLADVFVVVVLLSKSIAKQSVIGKCFIGSSEYVAGKGSRQWSRAITQPGVEHKFSHNLICYSEM